MENKQDFNLLICTLKSDFEGGRNYCKVIKKSKIKLKQFLQRILQEIMEKKIFGTSDACPIEPATQRIMLKIDGF